MKYRTVLYAYLISLLVPLGLFLDAFLAVRSGMMHPAEGMVLLGSLIWIATAALVLLCVRNRTKLLSRMSKPLLALYSVYFTFALIEGSANLILARRGVVLYNPGTENIRITDPALTPGLSPKIRFTVNDVGLRGPTFRGAEGSYKIITVGASTTECAALDDSQEWPQLLMNALNAKQKHVRVWVANAGVSGFTSVHNLEFVQCIPMLSRADMLTFLIGAADMMATVTADGASTQRMLDDATAECADLQPSHPDGALFKRLLVYDLAHGLWQRWKSPPQSSMPVVEANWLPVSRHRRQDSPVLPLPSLEIGLREYQSRILALAHECARRGKRCVFLTQPYLARPDLLPAEQEILFSGCIGNPEHPRGHVSVADLARAMDAYNQKLLQVCREQNMECYDLATHIPKDTTAFYDDYHYTIAGARRVAEYLSQQLVSKPPFGSP